MANRLGPGRPREFQPEDAARDAMEVFWDRNDEGAYLPAGVRIRPATAGDESAIRHCAGQAYALYVPRIGRQPAPMTADYGAVIAAGHVRVAVGDDGAVLGYIVFYPDESGMLLENVAVLPAAAGRGIGKALIACCEDAARRLGIGTVRLYTNAKMRENLAMYPRLGYVQTARRVDEGFDRVFFEKPLVPRRA